MQTTFTVTASDCAKAVGDRTDSWSCVDCGFNTAPAGHFRELRSGTEPTKNRSALILSAMAITDQWTEQLRCPKCGKSGMAGLSQGQSDDIPTVHGVSDGFKAVQTEYGPDFHCGACNIPVEP
jgi:predicted RNA-binding Zn-ribbon protein involved in translation (DUF1610 family)